jgi:hypothetical protein
MTESEVSPSFIDALGKSMGFSEGDEEYCKGLHAFPKVCLGHISYQNNTNTGQLARGMPRSGMQSNLIQVALLYMILKECCGLAEANRTNHTPMSEIQARLKDTFTISQEQKVSLDYNLAYSQLTQQNNIHLIAGEMMLNLNRMMYMKLHLDMEVVSVFIIPHTF